MQNEAKPFEMKDFIFNLRLFIGITKCLWKLVLSIALILLILLFFAEWAGSDMSFNNLSLETVRICIESAGMAFTTIGFGDIHPKTILGKAICIGEGFLGIIFLGIITGIISTSIIRSIKR